MWLFYSSAVFLLGAEIAREVSVRINAGQDSPTPTNMIFAVKNH